MSQASHGKHKKHKKYKKHKEPLPEHMTKAYPCRICGKVTTNWIVLSLSTDDCCCSSECLVVCLEQERESCSRPVSQISLPGLHDGANIPF